MGRNFARFVTTLNFGRGRMCTLDAFSPFTLEAPLILRNRKQAPPVMLFGSYVCTRDGTQVDNGGFSLWQYGRATVVPGQ